MSLHRCGTPQALRSRILACRPADHANHVENFMGLHCLRHPAQAIIHMGYDRGGDHSFGVPWGQGNAVHRDHQTIGAIQDAQPVYSDEPPSLRQALRLYRRRIRWTAIFIYGASAAFGLAFWLLVLKFAVRIH
jgi:hypothetical protein